MSCINRRSACWTLLRREPPPMGVSGCVAGRETCDPHQELHQTTRMLQMLQVSLLFLFCVRLRLVQWKKMKIGGWRGTPVMDVDGLKKALSQGRGWAEDVLCHVEVVGSVSIRCESLTKRLYFSCQPILAQKMDDWDGFWSCVIPCQLWKSCDAIQSADWKSRTARNEHITNLSALKPSAHTTTPLRHALLHSQKAVLALCLCDRTLGHIQGVPRH